MICPLCGSVSHIFSCKIKPIIYYECHNCRLIFKSSKTYFNKISEKMRYELHNNSFYDQGYRNFLMKIFKIISPYLGKNMEGLDFGCGKNKVLVDIFQQAGFSNIAGYDPFFHNNKALLEEKYDFILLTEVVEHFYNPKQEFDLLIKKLLKATGYLGIMTSILYNEINFGNWYYKDDSTHVVFFKPETFEWLAFFYNLTIVDKRQNITIFKK
ncbi:MAG: class I SAM-dependent methyltransferase [Bacteroidetes bacterium]|nr:class I SAM-dependent methyltransferase [Bacteroidota bacterium]